MTFDQYSKDLGQLETFDKNVFLGDDKVPQKVCNLILAIALAYNDYRDVFFGHHLIQELGDIPNRPASAKLGLRNGISNTLTRVQIGFVHEIFNLIRDNSTVLDESSFKLLYKQLSKKGKKSWDALVSVSLGKVSNDPIAKALVILRNKVAFHYDAEEIGKSYLESFQKSERFGVPIVSRGAFMKSVRFYFADALSQNYMVSKAKDNNVLEFLNGNGVLIEAINQSLYELVDKFISQRSTWRNIS